MTKTVTGIPQYLIDDALDGARWAGDYDGLGDNSYSGRGMYGDTCASITFDSVLELGRFLFQLGYVAASEDCAKDVEQMVSALRTDSMGTGIVAYFPGFAFGD